jgi:hypothetical protein
MNHAPRHYFAYRSFWPELETMKKFHEVGVDTICFFAANTMNSVGEPYCKYPPIWLWYDQFNFEPLDRQIADILSANPDAKFICMVDLNSPQWLVRHLSTGLKQGESFDGLTKAITLPEWKDATSRYLETFLRYTEKKYSDRILAYVLACGVTDEWMDYTDGSSSASKNAAFRQWLLDHGKEAVDTPSQAAMDRTSFDEYLLDPATDQIAIDYWKFTSDTVVDAIKYFAKLTRCLIRSDVEIGVFYGYILELERRRLGRSGHLEYERLMKESEVDFLMSPGCYNDRKIGDGSGFMVPHGTVECYHKGFLHECDHRTHTYNPKLSPFVNFEFIHWTDEASDIAGMKREMALALINHTSLWWFDMWGGYYQNPEIYTNLRQMKKLWDQFVDEPTTPAAEVAMIVDPESAYYIGALGPSRGEPFVSTRNKLNRLGAPYEIFSLKDIPRISDFERYKFVIFPAQFEITPEKERHLRQYVLKNNRTVLWLYAPGISDGQTLSPERVRATCGTPWGTEGICKIDREGWNSIYIHKYDTLTPIILKQLSEAAGVTLYCEDQVPVYANSRLLAIHMAEGGKKTITLPAICKKVIELYSGETVAENAKTFTWEFRSPDTVLFELKLW